MLLPEDSPEHPEVPVIPVHEIRDYQRVNVIVSGLLNRGHRHVRLVGVSRHRLLLSGLHGPWDAILEIEGPAGPEVAAGLDAPSLVVVARQGAAEGAASGLRQGALIVQGEASDALGYRQHGGVIVACGSIGHRAGLERDGGILILAGPTGRLAGEHQRGGTIVALHPNLRPYAGFGRTGGSFWPLTTELESAREEILGPIRRRLAAWLPEGCTLTPSAADSRG